MVVELRVERVLVEEPSCRHSFILSCTGRMCRTPPGDVGIDPWLERQQRKDRV